MNRRLLLIGAAALCFSTSCSRDDDRVQGGSPLLPVASPAASTTIKVAVTSDEHQALLRAAADLLKQRGVTLEAVAAHDANAANAQLMRGEVAAVCFETRAFMDDFNRRNGAQLAALAAVNIAPYAVFTRQHTSMQDLRGGETVAIPSDPVGRGRALLQMRRMDWLQLVDPSNSTPTVADISSNWMRLQFREMPADAIPGAVDQVDFVVMDVRRAEAAGLDPRWETVAVENGQSRFSNFVVASAASRTDPGVGALVSVLTSSEMAEQIPEIYGEDQRFAHP